MNGQEAPQSAESKKKGSNKLAIILIVLAVIIVGFFIVSMAAGALIWGFMQDYTAEQTSEAKTISTGLADCSRASNRIMSCTYLPDQEKVSVTLKNTGSIDINNFWVNVQYGDGTASQNKAERDLEAGSFSIVEGTAIAPPVNVKVLSVECSGVRDTTSNCPAE